MHRLDRLADDFLIRTFLLCGSQLVRSAQNLIRKLRCDTG